MADKTGISWTDATWNPVTGCTKVSQGCKHCYAERNWTRLAANPKAEHYYGRAFTDIACHEDRLDQPLRWKKPRMIFVNSVSDLFHESVPDEFIDKVFAVMALSEQHIFQVLTKRPERMLAYLNTPGREDLIGEVGIPAVRFDSFGVLEWPLPNVWLGVSVEDQETANARIPILMHAPAAIRWVSAGPLLGPIDFESVPVGMFGPLRPHGGNSAPKLDWVVVEGESGPQARPMHPDWVESIQQQCDLASVPFYFKQWGEWLPTIQMSPEFAASFYRSNRMAQPGEDQNDVDDQYGTHCTVPQKVIIHNGEVFSIEDPRPFEMDFFGTRSIFRVGTYRAGCLLNGLVCQSFPYTIATTTDSGELK